MIKMNHLKKAVLIGGLSSLLLITGCAANGKDSMSSDGKSSSTSMSEEKKDSMDKDKMDKDKMDKDKMGDDKMDKDKMGDDKMDKSMDSEKDMSTDNMEKKSMEDEKMEKMNDGEMAPDFSLMDLDGNKHSLSDYKGKKVYMKLWASWCSICLSGLPEIDELSAGSGDDYVVLTVVSPGHNGEKSTDEFKKWFSTLDYKNMTVLLDEDGTLIDKLGVRAYPSQAFIGSDGVLVKAQAGHLSKDDIMKTLDSIK